MLVLVHPNLSEVIEDISCVDPRERWSVYVATHNLYKCRPFLSRWQVLRFLDQAVSKQSALNKKLVMRLKEKALREAEKRRKGYQKLTRKAAKKAERDDKMLEKQRKRMAQVCTE